MLLAGQTIDSDTLKLKCPKCQGKILETKKSYYCENWDGEIKCNFSIWKLFFGAKIDEKTVKELIQNNRTTKKIQKIQKKDGTTYDAYLILDEEKKIKADFSETDKKGKKYSAQSAIKIYV